MVSLRGADFFWDISIIQNNPPGFIPSETKGGGVLLLRMGLIGIVLFDYLRESGSEPLKVGCFEQRAASEKFLTLFDV